MMLCIFVSGLGPRWGLHPPLRPAPPTPQPQRSMRIPTPRHSELRLAPMPGMKSIEQLVNLAAEMGLDDHARSFQGKSQRLRNRGTEQHVHSQFRHASRQGFGRNRAQNELLALDHPAAPAPHHQKPGGSVEHGRNALLPYRDAHSHRSTLCNCHANDERRSASGQRSISPDRLHWTWPLITDRGRFAKRRRWAAQKVDSSTTHSRGANRTIVGPLSPHPSRKAGHPLPSDERGARVRGRGHPENR